MKLRTICCFTIFVMSLPTALAAQEASLPATLSEPAGQTLASASERELAKLLTVSLRNAGNFDGFPPSGIQPSSERHAAPERRLSNGSESKDLMAGVTPRAKATGFDPLPGIDRHNNGAYYEAAASTQRGKNRIRDTVAPLLLSLAVHAAVTWDAQTTNHFFHHCPPGYRPAEADPVMRPFAGNASIYPMANLIFAAPLDYLLFKTRTSSKPIRILTYAAAGIWVGIESRQAVLNMRNEQLTRR